MESLYLEDVLQLTGYTLMKRENDKRNHWRYQLYNPHKPLELKPVRKLGKGWERAITISTTSTTQMTIDENGFVPLRSAAFELLGNAR